MGAVAEVPKKSKKELREELDKLRKELPEVQAELKEAQERDWKAFAEDLIAKLFHRYAKGAAWLTWAKKFAEKNGYVYAPTGRRRNLPGVMIGNASLVAALLRRAVNSPIQGTASDVTATAARLTAVHFYRYLKKFQMADGLEYLPGEALKLVHDATYAEAAYEHMLAYLHITQWIATYGVTEYYRKEFGFDFNIEPEIEVEIGAQEDKMYKWDWTDEGLKKIVRLTLEDQVTIKMLKTDQVEAVFKRIFRVYRNPEISKYLRERYPILGVADDE
jgi:ribosomal protein L29